MVILFIIFLLYSPSLICSEMDNDQQEKEFTFERITNFMGDSLIINSVIRLKNNNSRDECSEDKQYIVNLNQNEITFEQVLGAGHSSSIKSQEAVGKRFLDLFSGIAKFYLSENKKPNFSVSFDLAEIPEEELQNAKNDYFQNYGHAHIAEFLNEWIATIRNKKKDSQRWRCFKIVQECLMQ
ncbi:MAG: hypothetical protein P4L22_02055 [Candidatus Babeliales bacterium]|nr:hypothetical protein [Candidatus Babeliales bacterium]